MVKSVFRYRYFLRSYKHLYVPCLPLHKVLNVGPLLCQASVQSIHPIVHNPDKNRLPLQACNGTALPFLYVCLFV